MPADEPKSEITTYEAFEKFLELLQKSGEECEILTIDDFGQGEPTMLLNNGLYKHEGGGKVTLIHDFSDIPIEWNEVYTDFDRSRLLFSFSPGDSSDLREYKLVAVDLKTFEITDKVCFGYNRYTFNDGYTMQTKSDFLYAEINGVSVDEETAVVAYEGWYIACGMWLGDIGYDFGLDYDYDEAWQAYEYRR